MECFKPMTPEQRASATVYTDALMALALRECKGKSIDGHAFTFELTGATAGYRRLTATDAFDGKRYTITIEPEKKP